MTDIEFLQSIITDHPDVLPKGLSDPDYARLALEAADESGANVATLLKIAALLGFTR